MINVQDHRFDFARQLARFGDDFWQLSRFARLFAEQTPLRIKAIRVALAARDEAAVRESADAVTELLHALDAPEAATIAEDLARCTRERDFGRARLLVIALEDHVDELVTAVKTWPPLAIA